MDAYSGERVVMLGDTIDGELAVVKTRIVTKQGTEIPVDYRMHRVGDRWLAYDVAITISTKVEPRRHQPAARIATTIRNHIHGGRGMSGLEWFVN